MHHQKRHKKVKQWKEAAEAAYIENNFGEIPPALVRVKIPFSVRRRRDPHNYCGTVVKSVIDGLVKAGAWPDDTPEFVAHIEPDLYIGETVEIQLWDKASSLLELATITFSTDPNVDT